MDIFTTLRRTLVCLLVTLSVFLPQSGLCQVEELKQALNLATNGYYTEADALYNLVIATHPENAEARLGRAYNHSWHQHLDQARNEFEQILTDDSTQVADSTYKRALIGLGYTLAWSEDYDKATQTFFRAHAEYGNDPEIDKGQAYVYLWEQNPELAREMFLRLRDAHPANPEFYVALAYADLQMYRTREARALVKHASLLDPENAAFRTLLKQIDRATPVAEVDIWTGYTVTDKESKFGLRSVGFSVQATRHLRPFFLYDNTLSLDNIGYLLNKQSVDTYFAGSYITWGKRHVSRLQYGLRDFHASGMGSLVMAEHAYAIRNAMIAKAGFLVGEGQPGSTTWMGYTGLHIPVIPGLALEPVYYLTDPSAKDPLEHRFSATVQFQARNGFELSGGGVFGSANAGAERGMQSITGAHAMVIMPLHHRIWLQGVMRYEHGVLGDYFVASAGIKLRFEK